MIRVSKDQILYRLPPNDAFSSFHSGFHENKAILDRQLRSAMEANNPALAAQELMGVKALWNALEMHLGKGPTACAVFNDGHSACFQINMLYPGAMAYIDGTHKDAGVPWCRKAQGCRIAAVVVWKSIVRKWIRCAIPALSEQPRDNGWYAVMWV